MRPLRQRPRQLIIAPLAAGVLPHHLAAQPAVPADRARTDCVPALVATWHTCAVGEFGAVGDVAGHSFVYAPYDVAPAPGDLLYPLHYRRVVIFEAQTPACDRS